MTGKRLQALAALMAAAVIVGTGRMGTSAAGPDALSGTVTSKEEGHMEGVVVTARGVGANHTVSVVSGADGKYHFPKTHIPNGECRVVKSVWGHMAPMNPADTPAIDGALFELLAD